MFGIWSYHYQKSLIAQLIAAKEFEQPISKGASNTVFGRVFHQQSILVSQEIPQRKSVQQQTETLVPGAR